MPFGHSEVRWACITCTWGGTVTPCCGSSPWGDFGMGWARELFRIPSYVGEANREAARRTPRHHQARPPPMSLARFIGQICVGIYFGTVALIGLNSLSFFYVMVLPLCVGAGVHLVSIAGHETSDLWKTLTACLITSPIFYGSALSPLPISLAASVTAAQNRQFKQFHPTGAPPKPLGSRLYRLGLAWLAFSAPLGYSVFHNTHRHPVLPVRLRGGCAGCTVVLPLAGRGTGVPPPAAVQDPVRSYRRRRNSRGVLEEGTGDPTPGVQPEREGGTEGAFGQRGGLSGGDNTQLQGSGEGVAPGPQPQPGRGGPADVHSDPGGLRDPAATSQGLPPEVAKFPHQQI
ncbi:hypothetical protein SKAU_G00100800, partial [Synaphobranchus kaupii]